MHCYYTRPMTSTLAGEDVAGGVNKREVSLDDLATKLRANLVNVAAWSEQLTALQAHRSALLTAPRAAVAAAPLGSRARALGVNTAAHPPLMAWPGGQAALAAVQPSILDYETHIAAQRKEAIENEENLRRQGIKLKPDKTIDWSGTAQPVVKYLTIDQRKGYEVRVEKGKFEKYIPHPTLPGNGTWQDYDTSKSVTYLKGAGTAIYVMTTDGALYVGSHSVGEFHHSSFLAGAPVACAGEIRVRHGKLTYLSNKSGHYWPRPGHLLQCMEQLAKKGVNYTYPVEYVGHDLPMKVYDNRDAFVKEAAGKDFDLEMIRLYAYWRHLCTPGVLSSHSMRWAYPTEKLGVYRIVDGLKVRPRDVRKWLKTTMNLKPEAWMD